MSEFRPFADDASVLEIDELSIENGEAAIVVHGSLELSRDKAGLAKAKRLYAVLGAAIASMESGDLPDKIEAATASAQTVKNPFA